MGLTTRAKASLRETQNLAEKGEPEAEFNLGNMYAAGRGVAKDDAAALRWYRAAAEKGDAKAQYGVGYMSTRGGACSKTFPQP